jgi:hypothetical protein
MIEDGQQLVAVGLGHGIILENGDEIAQYRIRGDRRSKTLGREACRVEKAIGLGDGQAQGTREVQSLAATGRQALIALQPVDGPDIDRGRAGQRILGQPGAQTEAMQQ